jgi:predicted nuclease of predicted toxin-antitoxin system
MELLSAYIHQLDIQPDATDSSIWDFAKMNGLVIVTKDADFSERMMISVPPPKVVHIKVGNMKFDVFYEYLNNIWPEIESLLVENKLLYLVCPAWVIARRCKSVMSLVVGIIS